MYLLGCSASKGPQQQPLWYPSGYCTKNMWQCVVVELVPLRGEKILRHAHKPGPWYLCISFRTTAHREWSTLVTARLPVARLTILDRLVCNYFHCKQKCFLEQLQTTEKLISISAAIFLSSSYYNFFFFFLLLVSYL